MESPEQQAQAVWLRRLKEILYQLTEPSAKLYDEYARRQARQLSSFTLAIIPLTLIMNSLYVVIANQPLIIDSSALIILIVTSMVYLLSRTIYYFWGAVLISQVCLVVILFTAVLSDNTLLLPFIATIQIAYLLLLSTRYASVMIVITCILVTTLPFAIPNWFNEIVLVHIGNIYITAILILALVYLRHLDLRRIQQQNKVLLEMQNQREQLRIREAQTTIIRDFVHNINHDIKTPLTTMNTCIYLIGQLTDDPKIQGYVEQLERQNARIANIMEDLQTMVELDEHINPHKTMVDAIQFMEELRQQFPNFIKAREIQFDYPNRTFGIAMDAKKIGLALMGLIGNAVLYSEPDTPIQVRLRQADDQAHFEVVDQGIGIAEVDLPHICERFYKVEQARVGSTGARSGLGLYMTNQIVVAHSGTLNVTSELHQGSTFCVTLPLNAAY